MPTAAEISPKRENKNERKGILKTTPSREPPPKIQKTEIDLEEDLGAAATDTNADAVMGGVPVLPSVFGGPGSSGSLSGFNYGGSLSF